MSNYFLVNPDPKEDRKGEACVVGVVGAMTTAFSTDIPNAFALISRDPNETLDIDFTSITGYPRYVRGGI